MIRLLLNEVRVQGAWERCLEFFDEGIETSATQAVATANTLLAIVNADPDTSARLGRAAPLDLEVHQALQRHPISMPASLVKAIGLTVATVNKSLAHLARIRVVEDLAHRQRGRLFSYAHYAKEPAAEPE